MSSDLTWLLVKDNNSFLVKRGGKQFSREPYNLRNVNCYKYSGLANNKVVDISLAPGARKHVVVSTKKTKVGSHLPAKSIQKSTLRPGVRRGLKSVSNIVAAHEYRPDLRKDALARFAALAHPPKIAQHEKKVRGKKAAVKRTDTSGEQVD